jgi:orotidine-5'-phosphate decarboxylase
LPAGALGGIDMAASESSFLSKKPVPRSDRLIVALDLDSASAALEFVNELGDAVTFYKLGLQLFMAGGYFELVEELRRRGKNVFVDLKLFDVPETVASAVRALSKRDVQFATVHGNEPMVAAAVREKGHLKILAVTALTSLDRTDLDALGFSCNVEELVLSRAKRAIALGCDGVVSSGLEAPMLRSELGDRLFVVTPGIRPVENRPSDDQKRVVDVEQAFRGGADYVVVGRPIRSAANPREAALGIQRTIASLFD